MKTTLQILIVTIAVSVGVYGIYNAYLIIKALTTTHQECGKIIHKVNDEVPVKHGTRTEFLFIMDWENGKRSDLEVSATTYFNNAVGNRVCFTFNNQPDLNFIQFTFGIIGFILLIVLFIIGLSFLWDFVVWVFKNEEEDDTSIY
jgi:hypothetical protein